MTDSIGTIRVEVRRTAADAAAELRGDVRAGLTVHPKALSPKWFYDERGSALFEQITQLPEYFATRAEQALLEECAAEVAALSGADTIVELGSGSSRKTRTLLDAFTAVGTLRRYVPLDVSESALRAALDALAVDYPGLVLHGVVGDFTRHLDWLPRGGRRMVAFLGGTIGNLLPAERLDFLTRLWSVLAPGEQLLLGTGGVVDPGLLVPAYNDTAGVTAEFNRNVLRVLNRELHADFDVAAFEHVALWDPVQEWIEMRLRARRAMTVTVADLGLRVDFAADEELRTEVSAKFRPARVREELRITGFEPERTWIDPHGRVALTLATAL